jgi:hypothetical protein
MKIPARIAYETLKRAWFAAQDAGHDSQAAHIAFLRAQEAYLGIAAAPMIVLLYGKEFIHVGVCECPLASHAQSTPSDTHTPTRDTTAPDMAGVADTQAVSPLPPPPVKEQPTDEQRAKAKAWADGLREQARLAQAQKQLEAENRARGAMALWDRP